MENYIIELNNVSCKSGYQYLLKDVSWKINTGEHWIVFGMNGSGKTTLLSIIAGFQHYTEGIVKIFGQEFNNENILRIRRRIGWVSASFFDKYFTKESALHIVLSGKHGSLGLSDDITLEDVQHAKYLLTELQLANKIDYPFNFLSKGERQNVLIARALFSNPDILILDEPCTGLDIYNRNYLFATIEELSKIKTISIIYVTHYVEEIIPLFKKTLLLKNGGVFSQGDTDKIFIDEIMQKLLEYPVKVTKSANSKYQLQLETQSALAKIVARGCAI